MRRVLLRALVGFAVVFAGGCGKKSVESTGAPDAKPQVKVTAVQEQGGGPQANGSPEERWKQLAATANKEKPNLKQASAVAAEIAKQPPEAKDVYLAVLEDAASSPYAKSLAVVSFTPPYTTGQIDRLLKLTEDDRDDNTRWCAAMVLGYADDPRAVDALKKLSTASNHQVRYHALRGLAFRSKEDMVNYLALWDDPKTTDSLRNDIVMQASAGDARAAVATFEKALKTPTLREDVRAMSAEALGRAAQASSLPILQERAENDASESVRAAAKAACKAIELALQASPTNGIPGLGGGPMTPLAQ